MNSLLVEVHFDAVRYDYGTLDVVLFEFCSLFFSIFAFSYETKVFPLIYYCSIPFEHFIFVQPILILCALFDR